MASERLFTVRCAGEGPGDMRGVIFLNGRVALDSGQAFKSVKDFMAWIRASWPKWAVDVPEEEAFK